MQYSEQIVLVWSYNSTIKLDRGHAKNEIHTGHFLNEEKEAKKTRKQKPRE